MFNLSDNNHVPSNKHQHRTVMFNKSAFDKNYIQGKYGAIPYFEIDDKPSSLLYGEE